MKYMALLLTLCFSAPSFSMSSELSDEQILQRTRNNIRNWALRQPAHIENSTLTYLNNGLDSEMLGNYTDAAEYYRQGCSSSNDLLLKAHAIILLNNVEKKRKYARMIENANK